MRLQAALDKSAAAAGGEPYPDLADALRRALDRIEASPPTIDVYVGRDSPPVQRTLGAFAVQRAISYALSDPDRAGDVADAILAMAAEEPDYTWMAYWGWSMPDRIDLDAMPTVMDLASGISEERQALVDEQAATALLSDAPNFPMPHLYDSTAPYALPDSFREPPISNRPALIFSGTLDGRTYPPSALEATEGLSDRTIVTVENAGHNLFFDHEDVVPTILRFLDGDVVETSTLIADPPQARPQ